MHKLIYIDAENVGGQSFINDAPGLLSMLEESRTFVFLKNELDPVNRNPLVTVISDYETGKNQADFAMVAHLSSFFCVTGTKNYDVCLYSRDTALALAFKRICGQFKARLTLPMQIDQSRLSGVCMRPETRALKDLKPVEVDVLSCFSEPVSFGEALAMATMGKSRFQKGFNALLAKNLLVWGGTKNKKIWYVNECLDISEGVL